MLSDVKYLTVIAILLGLVASNGVWAGGDDTAGDITDPNGLTGTGSNHVWLPIWTKYFKECFEKENGQLSANLRKAKPSDYSEYCQSSTRQPSDYKYWLPLFIPLAGKESDYNPADHSSGSNQGLFQMSQKDMESHHCGSTKTTEPKDNICCAIKIASDNAQKTPNTIAEAHGGGTSKPAAQEQTGAAQEKEGESKDAATEKKCGGGDAEHAGIFSSFWQPMRDGMGGNGQPGGDCSVDNTKNHNDIKEAAKKLCGNEPVLNGDEMFSMAEGARGAWRQQTNRGSAPAAKH